MNNSREDLHYLTNKLINLFYKNEEPSKSVSDMLREKVRNRTNKFARYSGWVQKKRNKTRLSMSDSPSDEFSKSWLSEKYPYMLNFFYNLLHRVSIEKTASKERLESPWQIRDGIHFFYTSPMSKMPYSWESTLKIVDKFGDDVALINSKRRSLAKIITLAPDLYKLLTYAYLNRDELFKESVDSKHLDFFERLESTMVFLSTGYGMIHSCIDENEFMKTMSSIFITHFLNSSLDDPLELAKAIDGEPSKVEHLVWNSLRISFFNACRSCQIGEGEQQELLFDYSYDFVQQVKDPRYEINETNIKEAIKRVFKINVFEVREGEEIDEYPYLYDLSSFSLDDYEAVWNTAKNQDFDSAVLREDFNPDGLLRSTDYSEVRMKDVVNNDFDLKEFLINAGVRFELASNIPDYLASRIESLIHDRNKTGEDVSIVSCILEVMFRHYDDYANLLKNYNFDIIELTDEISDYDS